MMSSDTRGNDFVDDSEFADSLHATYCPLDEADQLEDLELYRPGGFHPVITGDFLGDNHRFDVWNKLGQGTFGIVWLCHDEEKKRFCAVKVLRDDLSKSEGLLSELRIKDMLRGVSLTEAWENHVAMPFEYFWQSGPNGRHLCIVMPLLGPSISTSRVRDHDNTPFLKDICFQLVEGVAFLHKHGLCHGDFRSANILFKTTLADLSTEQMEAYMPSPIAHEIWRIGADSLGGPHAPKYAVQPMSLTPADRYISKDIAIIDFGTAFATDKPPDRSLIPTPWAAPEDQPESDAKPGLGSDLWSLGCTISEILCGQTPFENFGSSVWSQIEETLGPVPEPYRSRLIEIQYSGILPDFPAFPLPLFTEPRQLEGSMDKRLESDDTEDILTSVIGSSVKNPHPDWDFVNGEMRPIDGKGWGISEAAVYKDEITTEKLHKQQPLDTLSHDSTQHETDGDETETNSIQEAQLRSKKPKAQPIFVTRQLDPAAVTGAVDLLKQVLRWLPEDRVPAAQLLDHEWFEGRSKQKARSASIPLLDNMIATDSAPPQQGTTHDNALSNHASSLEQPDHTSDKLLTSDTALYEGKTEHGQGNLPLASPLEQAETKTEDKSANATSRKGRQPDEGSSIDDESGDVGGLYESEVSTGVGDPEEPQRLGWPQWIFALDLLAAGIIIWVGVRGRRVNGLCGLGRGVCETVWRCVRRMSRG